MAHLRRCRPATSPAARDSQEAACQTPKRSIPVRNPLTGETEQEGQRIAERVNAGSVFVQDTFLTFAKLRKIGTHSFGVSGLGGSRTGLDSIMRFLRRKAIMSNHGAPANILDEKAGAVAGPRRG